MKNYMLKLLEPYAKHPDFLGMELTDVNQRGAVDDAPLHIAVRSRPIEDVIALIHHGADVNMKGDMDNTPLHFSAMTGRTNIVEALLRLGASPVVYNEFGQTPREVARIGGHHDVEKILSAAERSPKNSRK